MPELDLQRSTAADGRDLLAAAEADWSRPIPHCPAGDAADRNDLAAWYLAHLDRILDILSRADPEAPTWTFSSCGDLGVAWWRRRLAVELAIHRWDAQHAASLHGAPAPRPPDGDTAAAGTAEFMIESSPGCWPRTRSTG